MISSRSGILPILLFYVSLHAHKPLQLIEKLTVYKNRIEVTVDERFKKKYLKSDFFVEYEEDINLEQVDYSIVSLPFLMNVLSLVWISGEEYLIEEMDSEVYESLERLHTVFEIMFPKTSWKGRLIPKKIVSHEPIKEKVPGKMALLFSGGVDSTASSFLSSRDSPALNYCMGQSGFLLMSQHFGKRRSNR